MSSKEETALRQAIIDGCLRMNSDGMNQGTSGNISARYQDRMLITPSATPYGKMKPEMLASMSLDAADQSWEGTLKPSTEWHFHRDILMNRPDSGAVVHLHAPFCTVLAIAHRSIPACHYMVACFGGNDVRCGGYPATARRNSPGSLWKLSKTERPAFLPITA